MISASIAFSNSWLFPSRFRARPDFVRDARPLASLATVGGHLLRCYRNGGRMGFLIAMARAIP